jgi:hypothetical protein
MAMMDNSPLHLRQPTGIFRCSDRMTFSARLMECPGRSLEFHFSAPRHRLHDTLQFLLQDMKHFSVRLPCPVNKMNAAPFYTSNGSFPLGQFWRYRGMALRIAKVRLETSACNVSRFRGMFLAEWIQYLINEVVCSETILLWQKIHNGETIRIEKLPTLISRPRSFEERVLGSLRPDSTTVLSDNSPMMPRTHHQCRTPSSSSAVPSQARPAAKQ